MPPDHPLVSIPATSLPDGADAERMAADLADAEARFAGLFERSAMGMTITSLAARSVRVNPAFARMVGRSVDELTGMHVSEVTHPQDIDHDGEALRALVADPTVDVRGTKRYVRPGGREVRAALTVPRWPGPTAGRATCSPS